MRGAYRCWSSNSRLQVIWASEISFTVSASCEKDEMLMKGMGFNLGEKGRKN